MAQPEALPTTERQNYTLEAEFIQTRLPEYHTMFSDGQVCYDGRMNLFTRVSANALLQAPTADLSPAARPAPGAQSLSDQLAKVGSAIKHWDMIFPTAMAKFSKLPGISAPHRKPEYDIRLDKSWVAVYDKLNAAKTHYTEETGAKGKFRKVWRWAAENGTEPVRAGTKVVPQMDVVTPVLGAVLIVLDAAKKNAEVRQQTLDALDDLENVFSDVEMFLGTFKTEAAIAQQAVDLMVDVLLAVERAIGVFTSPGLKRGAKAAMFGKDYEKDLLDSLVAITRSSKKLMEGAVKVHIRDTQEYSGVTKEIHRQLVEGQRNISNGVYTILHRVEEVERGFNAMLHLLIDRHNEEKRRVQETAPPVRKTIVYPTLALRNLPNNPSHDRPPTSQQRLRTPRTGMPMVDQDELWRMLKIPDLDTEDMTEIEEGQVGLCLQDRLRTEQVVHSKLFQDWIVTPRSAKLLIQGNFSGLLMETSALSLFCTNLANTLRLKTHYLCLVWFCGRHLSPGDSESSDDSSCDTESYDGDYYYDTSNSASEFHRRGTKIKTIERMLRSLISQLLCDYDFGKRHLLPPELAPYLIELGGLPHLIQLFSWLVRQLPAEVTLFCFIDGVIYYEREEFEDPMLDSLGEILGLTVSSDVRASFKVLVTSPWPTCTVRAGFEQECPERDGLEDTGDFILTLETLALSQVAPSAESLARELQGLENN